MMPIHSDSQWASLTFAGMVMKLILDNPLPDETPTSRVKQIGLMSIIYQMMMSDIETTVNNIMEVSLLSRPSVFEVTSPLLVRGLLREEKVLNSIGKGRASRFVIPEDVFNNLPKAPLQKKG